MKELTKGIPELLATMAGAGIVTTGVGDAFRDVKEMEERGENTTKQRIWCVVASGCLALSVAAVAEAYRNL